MPKRKPGESLKDQILNMRASDVRPALIVGNGKPRRKKQIAQHPQLFRKFAEIDSVDALLNFIKQFGRLTDEKEGDKVHLLLDEAKDMRESIAFASKHNRHPPTQIFNLKATVILNYRTGRIEQRVFPPTLLQALWLQFIHAPLSAAKLSECKYCGERFQAGGHSHRRLDARFCSHKHQVLFNSLKRSNPKLERCK
jgi:hypothetical protein